MVLVARHSPSAKRTAKLSLWRWIFAVVFAATAFVLMFVFASVRPIPPLQRGPPMQLATPNNTRVTTDVRGNLGPPEVMVQGGTDWLKDRWQAASDMHGTAIKGKHEVLLSFQFPLQVHSIELDWEAAFSKDYIMEGALANLVWFTLYDTREEDANLLEMGPVRKEGQSPGVKSQTPLHIIHPFARKNHTTAATNDSPKLQYFRLTIRSSAMGWGVSLWRVQIFGWPWTGNVRLT